MKLLHLTVVKGYDWEAVYDQYGTLIYEDHRIDWEYVLGKNVCKISEVKWVDEDWLIGVGHFPERYSEVVFSEV